MYLRTQICSACPRRSIVPRYAWKVLENLQAVFGDARSANGDIVLQKHDYLPQPGTHVKFLEATAYYFSHILPSCSDNPSVEILKRTASAMTVGYSKLFINDVIFPDVNFASFQAMFDINTTTI